LSLNIHQSLIEVLKKIKIKIHISKKIKILIYFKIDVFYFNQLLHSLSNPLFKIPY